MLIECGSCSGTGLYRGFCEPEGMPVVCVRCKGTGAGSGSKPFEGRKRPSYTVRGVQQNSTGAFFSAPQGQGPSISYEEFCRRVPAPEVS